MATIDSPSRQSPHDKCNEQLIRLLPLCEDALQASCFPTSSALIQEWSLPILDQHLPSTATMIVDRLRLLWTAIEQSKVAHFLSYNPLCNACGYTFKGQTTGWTLSPELLQGQDLEWFQTSNPLDNHEDSDRLNTAIKSYKTLILVANIIKEQSKAFRNAMFIIHGPWPEWIPAFPISTRTLRIPLISIPIYKDSLEPPSACGIPRVDTTTWKQTIITNGCTTCGTLQHPLYRCYKGNPRNLYRYPPSQGHPNGLIPP